jgi:hypothetical protein
LLSLSNAACWRPGGTGAARLSRAAFAASLCLAWSSPASAQAGADDSAARLRVLEILGRCNTAPGEEILVCGRRNHDRYRLSELGRREAVVGAGNVRGEAPRASTEAAVSGGCGIFQHQRRCSRAEMEEVGYFRGRDPLSFLGDLVTVLVDPDADVRPPPPIP